MVILTNLSLIGQQRRGEMMEVETRIGKFELEPMTYGEHNNTVRKAVVLSSVDGGKVDARIDHVTRIEWMLFYCIKKSPEEYKIKDVEDVRKLPLDVGEVLEKAADKLNNLSNADK